MERQDFRNDRCGRRAQLPGGCLYLRPVSIDADKGGVQMVAEDAPRRNRRSTWRHRLPHPVKMEKCDRPGFALIYDCEVGLPARIPRLPLLSSSVTLASTSLVPVRNTGVVCCPGNRESRQTDREKPGGSEQHFAGFYHSWKFVESHTSYIEVTPSW